MNYYTKSKFQISLRDSGSIPDVGSSKINIYDKMSSTFFSEINLLHDKDFKTIFYFRIAN